MYAKLVNNLDILGFTDVEPYLSKYLSKAAKDGVTIQDALLEISNREIELRDKRAAQIQVSVSHFPFIKTFDEYDFHFQPNVSKTEVKDLFSLRFMEQKENILFYGTPGTGKTHLATAIGIEAAKKRRVTYFITCHDLIQTLRKAYDENLAFHSVLQLSQNISNIPVNADASILNLSRTESLSIIQTRIG